MNIGEYFIIAGSIIQVFVRTPTGAQIANFLDQVGTALTAGTGSVGPITVGSETLTVTIAPKG